MEFYRVIDNARISCGAIHITAIHDANHSEISNDSAIRCESTER